jgi:phosphoribosylaminoimidazole-succinocarboxamide synthase
MMSSAVFRTEIPGYPRREGKVRDVYHLGDRIVLVATDRVSAFDWVMPNPIPGKGKLLTAMTLFWLNHLGIENHFLTDDLATLPDEFRRREAELAGRTMIVRKTEVIPFECVARGYLAGSGWKEYRATQTVCGLPLPAGLPESAKLDQPIFTPATKAESGHDENISFEQMAATLGQVVAADLRTRTLAIYQKAADYAAQRGLILADTKFEFGRLSDGTIILIDEVLTPDSSRYWPADQYQVGTSPSSFDKQFLRDWLVASGWDRNSPPPELPEDIIAKTQQRYAEALARLTG